MPDWLLLILILEEDFVSIIYYFKFIYFVQDLFFETGKSKYLIYTAYIIFGVNVLYGIQWLLKELISTIST